MVSLLKILLLDITIKRNNRHNDTFTSASNLANNQSSSPTKTRTVNIAIHRGSYMSANFLLNLLNELGKRDKMRGSSSILFLFRNEFNKFNNTGTRMLDSIYHMTKTLKSDFWRKNVILLSLCTQRYYGRHNISSKSINHKWFIDFIAWRYLNPRGDVI